MAVALNEKTASSVCGRAHMHFQRFSNCEKGETDVLSEVKGIVYLSTQYGSEHTDLRIFCVFDVCHK